MPTELSFNSIVLQFGFVGGGSPRSRSRTERSECRESEKSVRGFALSVGHMVLYFRDVSMILIPRRGYRCYHIPYREQCMMVILSVTRL